MRREERMLVDRHESQVCARREGIETALQLDSELRTRQLPFPSRPDRCFAVVHHRASLWPLLSSSSRLLVAKRAERGLPLRSETPVDDEKSDGSFGAMEAAVQAVIRAPVTGIRQIAGGDDNEAFVVTAEGGRQWFVKRNSGDGAVEKFEAEQQALGAIRSTKSVRVPSARGVGQYAEEGHEYALLVMEHLPLRPGSSAATDALLGEQLAAMHSAPLPVDVEGIGTAFAPMTRTFSHAAEAHSGGHPRVDPPLLSGLSGKGFGFHADNTCGPSPQVNRWTQDWVEFFCQHRLRAQMWVAHCRRRVYNG